MKVLSRTSDNLKRCYNVLIDPEEVSNAVYGKLKQIAQKVKMHGFRPGKVPVDIIRRTYGASASVEAKKELVENMAKRVLSEEKLSFTFAAATNVVKDDENGIEFTLEFELAPAIELVDFSSIELVKRVPEITDKETNDVLNEILGHHKKWIDEPADKEVEIGNRVFVDLVTKTKIRKLKDDVASDFDFVVGDADLIEDFWKPLLGAKVSDVRELIVSYPPNALDKSLAGKTVEYSATIKKVQRATDYAVDDEFAKFLGHENIEETKEWAKSRAMAKYEYISRDLMKRDLLEKISEMFEFDVPTGMLDMEYSEVVRQLTEEARKINKKMTPEILQECRKIAEQRVRIGFVIAEVAKKEKIAVSRNEVADAVRNIAMMYPGHEKEVWDTYSKGEAVNAVVGPILELKVVNFLFDTAKTTEESCSVEKLIELDEEPFDFFKDDGPQKEITDDSVSAEAEIKDDVSVEKDAEAESDDAAEPREADEEVAAEKDAEAESDDAAEFREADEEAAAEKDAEAESDDAAELREADEEVAAEKDAEAESDDAAELREADEEVAAEKDEETEAVEHKKDARKSSKKKKSKAE
ncbi:hypothetical protein FACS189449_11870 [Alphaproteobacteria bacterium]|nr:hypothetical protein FACS189449_11870 [Alphaproteobacteria bacterium]